MQLHKPTEFLAAHALATLPDSISARRELLQQITQALPKGNEVRIAAQTQIQLLQQQDDHQQTFTLLLTKGLRDEA